MNEFVGPEYQLDNSGRRLLRGLTYDETLEFERLDASLPYDGLHVWPVEGLPLLPMEQRWLELWDKHQAALAALRAS